MKTKKAKTKSTKTKPKTKQFTYRCPSCKKTQSRVWEWQTISIAYEFDLNFNCQNEPEVDRSDNADHEAWTCPDCGKNLPVKICRKIEELLWGF